MGGYEMRKIFAVSIMILICVICIFPMNAFAAMSDEDFLNLCRSGTEQQVETAIKNGSNINAKTENGVTALMFAAYYNSNPEVISILLKNGVDVSIKDNNGERAIDYANNNVNLKNTSAYQQLLEASNEVKTRHEELFKKEVLALCNRYDTELSKHNKETQLQLYPGARHARLLLSLNDLLSLNNYAGGDSPIEIINENGQEKCVYVIGGQKYEIYAAFAFDNDGNLKNRGIIINKEGVIFRNVNKNSRLLNNGWTDFDRFEYDSRSSKWNIAEGANVLFLGLIGVDIETYHRGGYIIEKYYNGESEEWPLNCAECAGILASFLNDLRVIVRKYR